MENATLTTTEFAEEVRRGLSSSPKYLQSKYLYDQKGSEIFEAIMRMDEYYLTDCELEIFSEQKNTICRDFISDAGEFEIIELGAGDGLKTKILLKALLHQGMDFRYIPIDISHQAIMQLQQQLASELPQLKIEGLTGDYFHLISGLNGSKPKIALFLGSNIGNFTYGQSVNFLQQVRKVLNEGDKLLIGFDLKKDPEIILKAYNDPQGLTAAFNLNLLTRINEELEADFNTANFVHKEKYDQNSGAAKSFLVSKKEQAVRLEKLDMSISFAENETIFVEISQKYDEQMISEHATEAGFRIIKNYYDHRKWFVNSLWGL